MEEDTFVNTTVFPMIPSFVSKSRLVRFPRFRILWTVVIKSPNFVEGPILSTRFLFDFVRHLVRVVFVCF